MKLYGLKTEDNYLFFIANSIEFGKLDEYEPTIDKWAMYDEDGKIFMYALDNNFTKVEFDKEDVPEDFETSKYFFVNGEFVLNPDWTPAPPTLEEKVAELAEDVAIVAQSAEDSEEALCDLDGSIESRLADIEEALCELAEMLS